MGFCLLNNVAIAAAHARARGLSRVAIVDWDVHHGNGTQEAFERDPGVLFVSLHQAPLYPGSGEADEVGRGDGTGYTVNVPLSAEAGGDAYGAAFERIVLPIVDAYEPELILVSAGFDAHAGDPLGGMRLDAPAYARMTAALVELADAHAAGRIALLLEGGYRLDALEGALAASTRALLVRPEPARSGTLDAAHEADLARAVATHRSRWKL
jgi:acetoin utilization deacetylase AcuC-like enzyme